MKKESKDLDWLEARLKNQLRIHWKMFKDQPHDEVVKYVMAIIRNNAIQLRDKNSIFDLDEEESNKAQKFIKKQMKKKLKKSDVSGARFEYSFIPTGIGDVVTIRDLATNEEMNVTNYDCW